MKYYMITLRLNIGEYEKQARHMVQAEDEDQAGKQALQDEAHNELEWLDDYSVEDEYMRYTVQGVKEVAPEHVAVLKEYL